MGTTYTLQTPGGKRLRHSDSQCQNLRGNLQHTTLEVVEGVVRLRRLERQEAMPAW